MKLGALANDGRCADTASLLKKDDIMIQQSISVPDFVADYFQQPLRHPNPASDAVDRSVERVYRLINAALEGLEHPDWRVGQHRYHSPNDIEPYCFSRIEDKFYIWVEERGRKSPISVSKSRYLAADYFFWIVSQGKCKINWDLFMDSEP